MGKFRRSSNEKKDKKNTALTGLFIALFILVLLFMFLKTLFWIGLVIVVIIFGIWAYKQIQNENTQIS
jgi:ABC-type bacteriocin/lantibiotic exporter with double-glycine peptidase domain